MAGDRIAEQLQLFTEKICPEQSLLYEQISLHLTDDQQVLEIVRASPDGQPVPLLTLAAVHFLLLGGIKHELANYYPSCVEYPLPPAKAFEAFRSFCLEHEDALRELQSARRVQTNEVRRCAILYPALSLIGQQFPDRPLALIEAGTSAGLLLNCDRYAYQYGEEEKSGNLNSAVLIRSEWKGKARPELNAGFPKIVQRLGIDLHVVDVTDPAEARWLRSLIWPDEPERMKLLEAAIEQFKVTQVDLREGDAFDLLPAAVESMPEGATICLFHSHTLNQFSESQRQQFEQMLSDISQQHSLIQLSAEWISTPQTQLELIRWEKGSATKTHLANVDHHGRWVEWLIL